MFGIDEQAGGPDTFECHRIVIDHFTVISLVPSPLSGSEAELTLI